jgi:hypothetical protein
VAVGGSVVVRGADKVGVGGGRGEEGRFYERHYVSFGSVAR